MLDFCHLPPYLYMVNEMIDPLIPEMHVESFNA